jgi:ribonuclease HII
MNPSFDYERKLWDRGLRFVGGADEVGRGAFAGPIVAAACAFAPNSNFQFPIYNQSKNKIIINDSKKLSSKQRELASIWIKENCLAWGVGAGSVYEINKYGIVKATNKAFRRAMKDLKLEALLVDAFYVPYVLGIQKKNQTPIIKGDAKSLSIAAASIIAKVYRDKIMQGLSKKFRFKKYGWAENMGYGTAKHRVAILKHGTTRHHRKDYLTKLFASQG